MQAGKYGQTAGRAPATGTILGLGLGICLVACGSKHRDHGGTSAPAVPDAALVDDGGASGDGDAAANGPAVGGGGLGGIPGPVAAETAVNDAVADFRGFLVVDGILTQRLMADGGRFFLGTYLDSYRFDDLYGLPQLLGYDVGGGVRAGFRNGKANAINMVLWHLTLTSLAADVARHCRGDAPVGTASVALKPRFLETLQPLCAWPAAGARSTAALVQLWQGVLSYDAPRAEFEAFKDFFQGPTYAQADGEDAVAAMMTAMLLNPHFLVRK
jgi:hypothetical protein